MTCEVPDDTVTDIDADTLEHSLLDHNNESTNDNIQKKHEEALYSEVDPGDAKKYRSDSSKDAHDI